MDDGRGSEVARVAGIARVASRDIDGGFGVPEAFVDLAITVVVHAVAYLRVAGERVRVLVVAVIGRTTTRLVIVAVVVLIHRAGGRVRTLLVRLVARVLCAWVLVVAGVGRS